MILVVDNYDSFTYNLVHQLPNQELKVLRNDDPALMATAEKANGIILSPGPGRPEEAGLMPQLIEAFYQSKPILGICLGHQAIANFFGSDIVLAPEIRHGKSSPVTHKKQGLFKKLDDINVMRYHSLVADEETLPEELVITARASDDQMVMAIQHRSLPIYGLQFHPESIGTAEGQIMIDTFLEVMEESA